MKRILFFIFLTLTFFNTAPRAFAQPSKTAGSTRLMSQLRRSQFSWSNKLISSSEIFGGSRPEVAYGRGKFGVVFEDTRDGNNEIYFALLDRFGRKMGEDLRITNDPGASWNPTISWNGRTFGIFWYDHPVGSKRGIYYASVSLYGKLKTLPVRINNAGSDGVHPSAVWNTETNEYGVVWWDSRVDGTYFARVDREGKVVKETAISTLGSSGYYRPLIGSKGDEYVVVWEEWVPCSGSRCPEMAFARVANDGSKIGTDQVITAYGATRAKSIVWNGSEWGVLAGMGHYAKLLRVSRTGEIIELPIPPDSILMSNAQMIWVSTEYVTVWIDGDVMLQTFDRNGSSTRDPIRVSQTDGPNWNSSAPVQAGRRIGIVWVDKLYEPDQAIYFTSGKMN